MRVLLATMLLSVAAAAEEREQDACRYEGDTVVCTKDGFTRITHRYMDLQAKLKVCEAEKAHADGEAGRLRTALESCAGVPPAPAAPVMTPCPPQRNATLQHVGFALGVVGTAVAVMAPFFPNLGPVNQGLLIAGGAVTTGLGYIVTF